MERNYTKWDEPPVEGIEFAMSLMGVSRYRIAIYPGVMIFQVTAEDAERIYNECHNDGKMAKLRPFQWQFIIDVVRPQSFPWWGKRRSIAVRTQHSVVVKDRIKL